MFLQNLSTMNILDPIFYCTLFLRFLPVPPPPGALGIRILPFLMPPICRHGWFCEANTWYISGAQASNWREESRPEDVWFPMDMTMDPRSMRIYYATRHTPKQRFWRWLGISINNGEAIEGRSNRHLIHIGLLWRPKLLLLLLWWSLQRKCSLL
jgi:hypothetical protein